MANEQHRADHKAFLDDLLGVIPGVKISRAFGYPVYKVNGRIFCFVGGDGVSIKLPEARVKALIAERPGWSQLEVSEGTVWREWLSIDHADVVRLADDLPLFEESISYVAG